MPLDIHASRGAACGVVCCGFQAAERQRGRQGKVPCGRMLTRTSRHFHEDLEVAASSHGQRWTPDRSHGCSKTAVQDAGAWNAWTS